MTRKYTELTFTDSVKEVQERYGSRQAGAMLESFAKLAVPTAETMNSDDASESSPEEKTKQQ